MNLSPDLLPTEANHFKVHYAPWLGFTLLPIGILNLVLVLWLILLEGTFNSGIITGVVCTVVGYLYCTRPYFSLAPNRLTVYNLLGSALKRYSFASFQQLNIEGKHLYMSSAAGSKSPNNQHEKVKVAKWLAKSADWQKLEAIITADPQTTEPQTTNS